VMIDGNAALGIGLAILYSIILISRQIIEPKILASSLGLNPLAALAAMVVGVNLFGILGLFIGPAVLVILMALHRANAIRDLKHYVLYGKSSKM
jgi:predicted PurR-regulated permease PerM